jgi:DUF4097 and DUF4098 domain-containing protein YvlB
VRATVTSKSGDVNVRTGTGPTLDVTLRANDPESAYLLELAEIRFDTSANLLEVRTLIEDASGSTRRFKATSPGSWFNLATSDLDIELFLPSESAVEVKTVSGDTTLEGTLDEIFFSGVSGDVRSIGDVNAMVAKTTSGDVVVGHVRDSLRCSSASGDVSCHSSARTTEISSASGDVHVTAEQPGELTVKSVSGDVQVVVARGLVVDINGKTVTGDMGTNIDLDSPGDIDSADELTIKVSTVSGDVRIDKAS